MPRVLEFYSLHPCCFYLHAMMIKKFMETPKIAAPKPRADQISGAIPILANVKIKARHRDASPMMSATEISATRASALNVQKINIATDRFATRTNASIVQKTMIATEKFVIRTYASNAQRMSTAMEAVPVRIMCACMNAVMTAIAQEAWSAKHMLA